MTLSCHVIRDARGRKRVRRVRAAMRNGTRGVRGVLALPGRVVHIHIGVAWRTYHAAYSVSFVRFNAAPPSPSAETPLIQFPEASLVRVRVHAILP